MRKLSKTLTLVGMLAPFGANALGIGEIQLNSALNQTLSAQIPLHAASGEDIDEVKVSLASPEAFAKAGLERHYSLTKLRFTPEKGPDGNFVILVSSTESIREPFLNFIIELHWPQGRMQREFTVLLDPPASSNVAEGVEELPDSESSPTYQRQTEPTQYSRPQTPTVRPRPHMESRVRERSIESEAARPTEPPVTRAEPVTGIQYGPITKNETLWSIAEQSNHDDTISQKKMLAALHKANPHAFHRNNINALKTGQTIIIPDKESIIRLTGAPSGRIVNPAHKSSPKHEYINKTQPDEIQANTPDSADTPQGQLKLLAPADSKTREELTSSDTEGNSGKAKSGKRTEPAAEAIRKENEEIRRQISEFQQQLANMQRMLVLKDEQIAALQAASANNQVGKPQQIPNQPSESKSTQQSAPSAPVLPKPGISENPQTPTNEQLAIPAQPKSESPQPGIPKAVEPNPPADEIKHEPVVQQPPVEKHPAPVIPKQQITQQPKASSQPAPRSPSTDKEEEGFISSLLSEPAYLIGTSTGLLVMSLLTYAWIKRRRAAMIDEAESILTMHDRDKTVHLKRAPVLLETLPSNFSEQSTTSARSSFLSEFTPSDFDALGGEMEEVDPISEADVYLAYGRYKQAEELIRSAIAQNPERDECKLKLLEIHYATENSAAFEEFAKELEPTHKLAKPDFWEKVVEMGDELCPTSDLFISKGKSQNVAPQHSNSSHFEHEEFSQAKSPTETVESSYPEKQAFDVDHDFEAEQENMATERQPAVKYDFFGSEEFETVTPNNKEEINNGTPTSVEGGITIGKQKTVNPENVDYENKTLDDVLAELGILNEDESHYAETKSAKLNEIEEDNSIPYIYDFSDTSSQKDLTKDISDQYFSAEDSEAEFIGLSEMDEEETKLDLAKAYVDMGDADSARVILEQVTESGNLAQKEEAWSLLKSIAKKEVNSR